jgi:putative ABC transport system permease protein
VSAAAGPMWAAWRTLAVTQWREQPLRTAVTVLGLALGVALGVAIYLIDAAALEEFDRATRRLVGSADIVIRAAAEGFDESWYPRLARDVDVQSASPLLELQLTVPAARAPLKLLGLDAFQAGALQPTLVAALGADVTRLFIPDTVVLSGAAARALQLRRGDRLPVVVGSGVVTLQVIDVLPDEAYEEPLALMDIASAQWTLQHLGRINRVDLRLRPGATTDAVRARLQASLPPGAVAVSGQTERGRAATATRAYRVNLNMLALVALLTGAFVVLATQSLSVLRRRATFGMLRALGVTRAELQGALLLEAVALGAAGSVVGLLLGTAAAALVVHHFGTDLGNRATAIMAPFAVHPAAACGFLLLGTAVAVAGAWAPTREAAARAPALALKAGDVEPALRAMPVTLPGVLLVLVGTLLAWLPPIGGLPLPGYAAIAAILIGAILVVPAVLRVVLAAAPQFGRVILDAAVAQLRGSAGIASVSMAAIIVSFSLMVAMAIMVHSFRNSFETWLIRQLPADVQLRLPLGGETAVLSPATQARIAALPGVERAEFRRVRQVFLRADRAPVTLIVRDLDAALAGTSLPLVGAVAVPADAQPVWISEAVQDLYGAHAGQWLDVPLAGRTERLFIAGVWRDYARPDGAIVIARAQYLQATGDDSANEALLWRQPGTSVAALEHGLHALSAAAAEISTTPELRERSLRIFDRAFAITYALEAAAVAVGLVGIGVTASSTALARRAQFGMLRHIGMLRRQVLWMLASEGVLLSAIAVVLGLLLGAGLSVILVYVINRESFHWSIDLAVPWGQLAALSALLIGASAVTALWSGRAAMSHEAVRAVREDW